MKRRRLAAPLIALTLAACGSDHAPTSPQEPKVEGGRVVFPAESPQLKTLVTATVTGATNETLRLNARVVWDERRTVRVFSPVAGRIVSLPGEPGRKLKAGDPLAVISSPDFGQIQSESARAEADFVLAERALQRARELAAAGILATKDLQQAEADHARAKAERDRVVARARFMGGSGSVDQQFILRAPIGGVLVERNANPGQELRPDQAQPGAAPLFVVSDPDQLWVQLELPEAALADVRPGMSFRLATPALGEQKLAGRIDWIADSVDPTTRSTRARGSIANPDRRLKAEMFTTAEITVPDDGRLLVPATAVLLLGDTQLVFVEESRGQYRRQVVRAEEAGFARMRIREGLKAGDRIVTDGALLLQQIIAVSGK